MVRKSILRVLFYLSSLRNIIPKNQINREITWYIALLMMNIAILCYCFRLFEIDISIPFSSSGDSAFAQAMIKGLVENGWYQVNTRLGAPGTLIFYDFPGADFTLWSIIKIISLFTRDAGLILNVSYLISYPLAASVSFLVFRYIFIPPFTSILLSNMFAFLPYHFGRGVGHLFLSSYYFLPFVLLIIFQIGELVSSITSGITIQRRTAIKYFFWWTVMGFVLGSSGIYYAFYCCLLLLFNCIQNAHRKKDVIWVIISTLFVIGIISFTIYVQLMPSTRYWSQYGQNQEVGQRMPIESEVYGLKLGQLIIPRGDGLISFGAFGRKLSSIFWDAGFPVTNEGMTSQSSWLIGLTILAATILFLSDRLRNPKLKILASMIVFCILFGSIGGLNSLVASYISPQLRAHNRISILIIFLALIFLGVTLDELSRKSRSPKIIEGLFGVVLMVFLLSQLRQATQGIQSYHNDKIFFRNLESIMGVGDMVLQLPFQPFPEHPPQFKHNDYDHFRAYLHTKTLRFSYGAIKGRNDGWQRSLNNKEPCDMVDEAEKMSFSGILVDSYGYEDHGRLLMHILDECARQVIHSADGRYFVYKLRPKDIDPSELAIELAKKSIQLVFSKGFSVLESSPDGGTWRWCTLPECEIVVINPSHTEVDLNIEFSLDPPDSNTRHFKITQKNVVKEFMLIKGGTYISTPMHIVPGKNIIKLATNGLEVRYPGDIRSFYFRVRNFQLVAFNNAHN